MTPHAGLLFLASLTLAAVLSLGLPTGSSAQTEDCVGAADDDCATEPGEGEGRGAGEEAGTEVGGAEPDGAAPGGDLALGTYECWHFTTPRLLLNFTLEEGGRYADNDGAPGTYAYDAIPAS